MTSRGTTLIPAAVRQALFLYVTGTNRHRLLTGQNRIFSHAAPAGNSRTLSELKETRSR